MKTIEPVTECTLCGFPVTPDAVCVYCNQCLVTQAKLSKPMTSRPFEQFYSKRFDTEKLKQWVSKNPALFRDGGDTLLEMIEDKTSELYTEFYNGPY